MVVSKLLIRSAVEQVAEYLREEFVAGVWGDRSPGGQRLARELGVNHKTVESALRQLENEGVLVGAGAGRQRRIVKQVDVPRSSLRVAILDYEPLDRTEGYMVELQHLLTEAGHAPFFSPRCLKELGMDVRRIVQMTAETAADAWVVGAGSRQVLAWFAEQDVPVFALFGRRHGLPIAAAGPDKAPVLSVIARRLVELGHRRIAMLVRAERRQPKPGSSERAFLAELESLEISPGPYNLPDWEESVEGFHSCLDSLFRLTPPTALIVDEAPFYFATQQYCGNRGIRVPGDVSLICTDADPSFAWHDPSVAHIRWDRRPVLRRIVRWAANVSHGRKDLRQTLTRAEFIDGGTVGPVREG